jgi:hypothetical protein
VRGWREKSVCGFDQGNGVGQGGLEEGQRGDRVVHWDRAHMDGGGWRWTSVDHGANQDNVKRILATNTATYVPNLAST